MNSKCVQHDDSGTSKLETFAFQQISPLNTVVRKVSDLLTRAFYNKAVVTQWHTGLLA